MRRKRSAPVAYGSVNSQRSPEAAETQEALRIFAWEAADATPDRSEEAEGAPESGINTAHTTEQYAPAAHTESFATRTFVTEIRDNGATDDETLTEWSVLKQYRKRSRMGEIFHSIGRNKAAVAGLVILILMVLTLIASLFISYEAMTASTVRDAFSAPNSHYPFGTDNLGRNLFLRVIYGTRYSLLIGVFAAVTTAVVGVFLGSIAGYYGKLADEIIMRVMDIVATMPGILLGMVIITVLGQTIPNVVIAVTIPGLPLVTRMTRASILTVKGNEFVEASKAIGLSSFRTVFTQVLPNALAPVIVVFTTGLGATILIVSGLSFLGFGVPVPHPEWGALISAGRDYMRTAPWLSTFPGIFILLTALSFNMLGDGLRDALDPKLKSR